ncbi:hypothetical protein LSM04_002181 [Trypanosoma melophagium]|uniref:uncharacterized protein n=1 Tax=Trypanosoma melophagium TaxID=715481 RepID=UPI00351A03F8|nr:hypothetical protein LSM04_002181 [Trypanosoma melophagium]
MALVSKSFAEYYHELITRVPTTEELLKRICREETGERKRIEEELDAAVLDLLHVVAVMISDRKEKERSIARVASYDKHTLMVMEQETAVWLPSVPTRSVVPLKRRLYPGFPKTKYNELVQEEQELRNWLISVELRLREPIEKACSYSWFLIVCLQQCAEREAGARARLEHEEEEERLIIRRNVFRLAPSDYFRHLWMERYGVKSGQIRDKTFEELWKESRSVVENEEQDDWQCMLRWLFDMYGVRLFSVARREVAMRCEIEEAENSELLTVLLTASRGTFGAHLKNIGAVAWHLGSNIPILRDITQQAAGFESWEANATAWKKVVHLHDDSEMASCDEDENVQVEKVESHHELDEPKMSSHGLDEEQLREKTQSLHVSDKKSSVTDEANGTTRVNKMNEATEYVELEEGTASSKSEEHQNPIVERATDNEHIQEKSSSTHASSEHVSHGGAAVTPATIDAPTNEPESTRQQHPEAEKEEQRSEKEEQKSEKEEQKSEKEEQKFEPTQESLPAEQPQEEYPQELEVEEHKSEKEEHKSEPTQESLPAEQPQGEYPQELEEEHKSEKEEQKSEKEEQKSEPTQESLPAEQPQEEYPQELEEEEHKSEKEEHKSEKEEHKSEKEEQKSEPTQESLPAEQPQEEYPQELEEEEHKSEKEEQKSEPTQESLPAEQPQGEYPQELEEEHKSEKEEQKSEKEEQKSEPTQESLPAEQPQEEYPQELEEEEHKSEKEEQKSEKEEQKSEKEEQKSEPTQESLPAEQPQEEYPQELEEEEHKSEKEEHKSEPTQESLPAEQPQEEYPQEVEEAKEQGTVIDKPEDTQSDGSKKKDGSWNELDVPNKESNSVQNVDAPDAGDKKNDEL